MKNSRMLEDANSDSVEKFLNELGPKPYSHEDLKRFTSNFSKSNKVGSGGYGKVYKGQFHDGLQVAVKVLAKKDVVEETFMAEVSTMGKAYHRNLVKLYGYCFEPNMKALVYEYMENGSLDKILYGNHLAGIEWEKLYDISIETAKGLIYLHDGCDERIIHYDIKASNVLLDKKFSPKITDFGLAKLMKRDVSRVSLSRIRGTVGYNAPETWMPGSHVTYKCDVYSFGMMLFEVLGKRSNGECENWFPGQVWKKFEKGQLEQIIQDCGITEKDNEKAKTLSLVALWCAQYTPEIRPSMLDVVLMLEKKIAVRTPPYPFQFMQPLMFSMLPPKVEMNPEVYSEGYESLPKKSTPANSSTVPPEKPTEFLETPRNGDARDSELSLQLLANKRLPGGYVLEKMDPGLWKIVLSPENEYRRELIDQVITVLPECKSPEQVSAAVKAFMTADLPHELIQILEKLVLYNSAFSSNFNLQNLLILSAIKADASRVMNYIHKLDNLDGPAVGEVAVEAELYEEAFFIFKKFNLNVQAVNVLLDNIQNIERAVEFAFNVDEDAVWSQVAKGQVKLSGYVLEKMDPGLWKIVLSPENEYRRELIDQVITALPECKSPEQVSAAVKAFTTADLPHELIEILEKLVLYNSVFSSNFNLQNLLILSVIKADASRVMNYIHKLDNFDGPAIGEVAVEAELYEEAFFIFKKFKMNVQAVNVLLDNIQNIERAVEFAFNVDEDAVWSQVAKGQVKLSGYVLEKMDPGLWKIVLSPENEYRRELIDQVITALPECKSPEQVSAAVKAFTTADLPHELIEILEKLVLYNSVFSSNFNLQNLLILSVIKADASRVMNYIHKLDNFDGPAIGEVAVEAELYEEAFFIFKKFKMNVQAVNVLLDNIQNIERAVEFAFNVDEDAVWSQVANGQVKLSKMA